MQPVSFPQANKTLNKPQGMTDAECGPLPVYNNGEMSISCWQMNWRERLSALFFGRVWLYVVMGSTQPPVALDAMKTIFKTEKQHAV